MKQNYIILQMKFRWQWKAIVLTLEQKKNSNSSRWDQTGDLKKVQRNN